MDNKSPVSIFTDQDQAMASAIANVFPDSRHRLCLWHISKNAPSNLNSFNSSLEFRRSLNDCLYQCETEEEFQRKWDSFIHKYNAEQQPWLQKLYGIREKWSPAFNNEFFHGGIRSTSRSESTNNALDEICTRTTSLSEFILGFEKGILESWRRNEVDADFVSSQGSPTLAVPNSKILRHAVKIYTNTMYKEFEKDYVDGTGALSCQEISCGGTIFEFEFANAKCSEFSNVESAELSDTVITNSRVYKVVLDTKTMTVQCSCKKFEWMGLLCSHTLAALHRKNVQQIPWRYICKHWTKNVKKQDHMTIEDVSNKMDKEARVIYTNMSMRFAYDLINQSAPDKEAREILWEALKNAAGRLDEFYKRKNSCIFSPNKSDSRPNHMFEFIGEKPILDPIRAKPKGTRNDRIKRQIEKKKRKTPNIGGIGKTNRASKASLEVEQGPFLPTPGLCPVPNSANAIMAGNLYPNMYVHHQPYPASSFPNIPTTGEISNYTSYDQMRCLTYGSMPNIGDQLPSFTWTMPRPQLFPNMIQVQNLTTQSMQVPQVDF